MTGKKEITSFQLFALTANFTMGTTVMSASSGVATLAKQDAWISSILACILGFLFIFLYCKLEELYPGATFVDMLRSAFGSWIGWIIAALFVLFVCFMDCAQIIYYIGTFGNTEYMTETPKYAFYLLAVIGMVIGLLYGLETISRLAEIFVFVVIGLISLALLLSFSNVHIDNILPILENGVPPVLKGTLYLTSYLTWPLIIFSMVCPSCHETTKKKKTALFCGFFTGSIINLLCTLMSLLVLGSNITSKTNYPTYFMAQAIDLGIVSRLEGVISGAWLITQFLKACLYCYAGLIGLSQLFGITESKRLVSPLGLIILVLAGVVYPSTIYQSKWDSTTWIPFIGTFSVVLPILLLLIALLKKAIANHGSQKYIPNEY